MRRFLIILFMGLACCARGPELGLGEIDQEPAWDVPQDTASVLVSPAGVPQALYDKAQAYYLANIKKIPNPRYMTIVDFSRWSGKARMWIINQQSGTVEAYHVAHGAGSDPKNSGYATLFGNVPNSYKSSLGFYLTGETYQGKHGTTLTVDGLESTNSNARSRAILIHGANYVYDQDVQAGRSLGCFAFPMNHRDHVIGELKNGSLLYAGLSGTK